jgi:hypothetical protein
MDLVVSTIESMIDIIKHSPPVELICLVLLFRVQVVVVFWKRRFDESFGRWGVRVFTQRGVASNQKEGKDRSVLPINKARNLVSLGGNKDVSWCKI